MTLCLVTGASGYVGSRLVAELAPKYSVVATARDVSKLGHFDWPDSVDRVSLDVTDEQSVRDAFAACPDVGVAYFLVHSLGEGDFAREDLAGAEQFARVARAAGVSRIVYLGGFVPTDEELSEHLQSRAAVGTALAAESVELVWLRAAIILGAGSTSFELIRHVADRLPVIPIPTWMNKPVSPIAIDDVVYYLAAAADAGLLPAGNYDISNGEQPTYAELLKAYAQSRSLRRVWIPMPPVPASWVARIGSWLTPLPHALTADLIMSLPNTMSSDDHRIRDVVPDPPDGLTSVADSLRRTLAAADPAPGVSSSSDYLKIADTDPSWAGPDEKVG